MMNKAARTKVALKTSFSTPRLVNEVVVPLPKPVPLDWSRIATTSKIDMIV